MLCSMYATYMNTSPEEVSHNLVELGSSSRKRQALPDQLRGFALLGIIVVNMPFLAVSNVGVWELELANLSDKVVAFLMVT